MSKKDWQSIGTIATVGGAIVALHGMTNRRWQTWHTVFVALATVAAVGSQLS